MDLSLTNLKCCLNLHGTLARTMCVFFAAVCPLTRALMLYTQLGYYFEISSERLVADPKT